MKEKTNPTTSPVPQRALPLTDEVLIDFPQAMQAVIDGKTITKKEWVDPESVCKLEGGRLRIRLENVWHDWIISDGDMMGKDWVIV